MIVCTYIYELLFNNIILLGYCKLSTLFAMGLVLGLSTGVVYAQEDSSSSGFVFQEEPTWKTFLIPYKLSFDYPQYGNQSSVNQSDIGSGDIMIDIDTPYLQSLIYIRHISFVDAEQFAIMEKQEAEKDETIVENLETVFYGGEVGYGFSSLTKDNTLVRQFHFDHDNNIISVKFYENYPQKEGNRLLNEQLLDSLRFLSLPSIGSFR